MTTLAARISPAHRFLLLLAGVLLASLSLLTAAPASAHDTLVATDPAADSTVATLPDELTLTFSADLLVGDENTLVEVTDSTGASLAGDPTVTGPVVTVPLTAGDAGVVTVEWQVVSSDGHPISGTFSFTVESAATPTESASPSESDTPTATASPEASATTLVQTATATPEPAPSTDDNNPLPLLIWLGILVVAVIAVVWLLGARARQQKAATTTRGTGGNDSSEG